MKLIAQRELKYGVRTVKAGETFEASEQHGRVLKVIKRAIDAPPDPPPPPPEIAKPVAPAYRSRTLAAEQSPPVAALPDDPAPTTSRYRRRDMQAEET